MMRTYRFGCRPPTVNTALAMEQLWRAHRYRNKLVEIERKRREEAAKYDKATDIGKKQIERANESASAEGRAARAACGVYWGSYLLVEATMSAARKGKEPPHFERWDGTGRVGVELQHGISVARAFATTDTRLRIEQIPDPPGMTVGSRRSGKRHLVSLRVGSDEHRDPIWASWPVTIHRALPADGIIKWAVAQRYRIGPDYRWAMQFSVEEGVIQRTDMDAARDGVVAIDLGWRARPAGFRAGYWLDSTGKHDELLMPAQVFEDLAHIRSIGATRHKSSNEFLPTIAEWCKLVKAPEWFATATETIAHWKSPNRLAALVWKWKRNRFDGDAEMFAMAEAWMRQDRHLHQWWAHGTENILGRRSEIYKLLAAQFARRYRTVVIEQFNLANVAGRRGLDEDATNGEKVFADNASSRRHVVAPGRFRQALLNACSTRGTQVIAVPAEYTTQTCWQCKCSKPWDAAPKVDHCCEDCGATWDQDFNACCNLLARHASGDGAVNILESLAARKSAKQERFRAGKEKRKASKEAKSAGCSQLPLEDSGSVRIMGAAVEIPAQRERI